jgi:hypothetical protein
LDQGYENRRENLWKEFDYKFGDIVVSGKHYSYFTQNYGKPLGSSEQETDVKDTTVKYKMTLPVYKVQELLDNKYRYKKKWNEHDIYAFSALQNYINFLVDNDKTTAVLSSTEYAMIQKSK